MAIIGILLVFPYEKENDYPDTNILAEALSTQNNNDTPYNAKLLENEAKNTQFISVTSVLDDPHKNETLKNAVCSKKFLACFIMAFCSSSKIRLTHFNLFLF